MHKFIPVWVGQLLSHVGAGLTSFALAISLYQASGSLSRLSQLLLVGLAPSVVAAPLAGMLVDKWGPRRSVVLSECGSATCTFALALLLWLHVPGTWPLFVALGASALVGALRWPALSLFIVQGVARGSFGRATGLLQLAEASQQIVGPLVAGLLIDRLPLPALVLLDCTAHLVAAVTALAIASEPSPGRPERTSAGNSGLWRAWCYLQTDRLMLLILVFAFTTNLTLGYLEVGYIPYVLSFSSAATVGLVMSLAGASMLAGALTLSVWGGPRRALLGMFAFSALAGGLLIVAVLRPSVRLLTAGACGFFFTMPYVDGCGRSFWLQQLPEEMIARVSVLRAAVVTAAVPIAYVTVAPLTSHLAAGATRRGLTTLFYLAGLLMIAFAVAAALACRRVLWRAHGERS